MNSNENLIGNLLQAAASTERLAKGRLLTPKEVEKFADGPLRGDERLKGWSMCATVHPELYKLLREEIQTSNIFIAYEGPYGIPILVTQHICQGWAHRFVFPVLGSMAWECVVDAKVRGFGISMASKANNLAVVSRMYPNGLADICKLDRPAIETVDIAVVADHLAALILRLLKPEPLVPTDKGINDACVTLMVSTELEAQMESVQATILGQIH